MNMKKILKIVPLAVAITAAAATTANAAEGAGGIDICGLITQMGGVFRTLRVLAFVGAAFAIAGWAWGYISAGAIGNKDSGGAMGELKNKGIALIVGFVLLFGVGLLLSFLIGQNGMCASQIQAAF